MILDKRSQRPPGSPPHTLAYEVDGDRLTIVHDNGETETIDTFDFTGVPDGELDVPTIETALPVQPILAALRANGHLTVTVLDWSQHG